MLIRAAEIDGSALVDVRIEGDRIAWISERIEPLPGERVLDARRAALLPGLHDHHIHLFALALAERSVRCGPPRVRDREQLAVALREAGDGWIRGVGYHESVAGSLDRAALDALVGERPLRIQHRSGALWMLNSAGARSLGLDDGADAPGVERDASGRATGRLFRLDGWLRERLERSAPPDLSAVGAKLARYGVTGVTDTTPDTAHDALRAFERAVERRELGQRLVLMGSAELPEARGPRVRRGALKVLLDESALTDFDALVARIRGAHESGRAVAIHAVTRAELTYAASAFELAGTRPGDRIEHASVAPPDTLELVRALGLTVVTQPGFLRERGDVYRTDVEERDRPWLYRCRGWLDAGVALGAGTDAPFGDPDPWLAMQAAVDRRSELGYVLGEREALDPERALALFTTAADAPGGEPRCVRVGEPADLCLLDRGWHAARDELSSGHVRATIAAGCVLWEQA